MIQWKTKSAVTVPDLAHSVSGLVTALGFPQIRVKLIWGFFAATCGQQDSTPGYTWSFSTGLWLMMPLVAAQNTGESWIFSIITTKHEQHGEPGHRARQENKTTGRVCLGSIFQENLQNQSVSESSSSSQSIRPEPCPATTGNQDMGELSETQFMSKYSLKGYLKCYPGLSNSHFSHLI